MKRSQKFFIGAIVSVVWITFWSVFASYLNPHNYNTEVLFALASAFIALGVGSAIFCLANGVDCAEKHI
jgi:hypothetical protein